MRMISIPNSLRLLRQSRRQRQLLRVGQVIDVVANVDGFSVDDPPSKLLAMTNAGVLVGVRPIDIVLILNQVPFGVIPSPSGRVLVSSLLAVGFCRGCSFP